jgi:uncharacterized protein (UPF0332 family)
MEPVNKTLSFPMNALAQTKMQQAREFLDEAEGLLEAGADLPFVLNSIFYAMLYPVLALLHDRGISAPSQGEAMLLFEREFIRTGLLDAQFLEALRQSLDLRPSCDCEGPRSVTRTNIDRLLPQAKEFVARAQTLLG